MAVRMHVQRYDYNNGVYNEIFSWRHGINVRTITGNAMIEVVAETTYSGKRVLVQIKKIKNKKNIELVETKIISIFGDRAEKAYNSIKKYLDSIRIGGNNA